MQSLVKPMRRPLAVLLAAFFGLLFLSLWFAPRADAAIRFCQTAKNVPCIGYINGCTLQLGGGKYVFAAHGDEVVDGTGATYKCQNGKWTKVTSQKLIDVQIGSFLGRGEIDSLKPYNDPCDPFTIFCPNPV